MYKTQRNDIAIAIIAFSMLLASESFCQTKTSLQVQLLWPDGAPGALGNEEKDKPKLHIYTPARKNGSAIVIFPGGGYGHLAMGHEGKDIAEWFNQLGFVACVCEYRHRGKGYGHPAPLDDAKRALRMVRANAAKWKIDPTKVGVIGFSAGGHLASTISNHFDDGNASAADVIERQDCRPDFAILGYPVIALGETFTHLGSQRNLLGKSPSKEMIRKFSNEKQVTSNTPPSFLWSTADDHAVKVENSLRYFAALRKNKVPAAIHVFPTGRHGLGMAKNNPSVGQWTRLCEAWLRNQGLMTRNTTTDDEELALILLKTGKPTTGVDKSAIEQMQSAHLANFRRLAAAGKLLTAGPLSDAKRQSRGIVVIRSSNADQMAKMFKSDPYIQKGYLKLEPEPIKIVAGSINTTITPSDLGGFLWVVFRRNANSKQSEFESAFIKFARHENEACDCNWLASLRMVNQLLPSSRRWRVRHLRSCSRIISHWSSIANLHKRCPC